MYREKLEQKIAAKQEELAALQEQLAALDKGISVKPTLLDKEFNKLSLAQLSTINRQNSDIYDFFQKEENKKSTLQDYIDLGCPYGQIVVED